MSSQLRLKDLEKRYYAHLNLMRIAIYHGVPEEQIAPYLFKSIEEYSSAWGETIIEGGTHAVLSRDSETINFRKSNGERLILMYIDAEKPSKNVKRTDVKERLKRFLTKDGHSDALKSIESREGYDEIYLIQGAEYKGNISIDLNLQLITYSKVKLDSQTMMDVIIYNNMIKHPMKHFTIEELQNDPTMHITAPKYTRVLNADEVEDLLDRQIGLRGEYGINDLGSEKVREREGESGNPYKQQIISEELRNLALSKLPTINSTDPLVKWRGYKLGDIIYIERRAGLTPICYRLVIRLDHEVYKESRGKSTIKIKTTGTNN